MGARMKSWSFPITKTGRLSKAKIVDLTCRVGQGYLSMVILTISIVLTVL
jgi:hypothetical protein